jgi:tripartite-type tricarboxylate transporter receptor subunit TctC
MTATRGLVVQAGADAKVKKALEDLLAKVIADPEFRDLMEKQLIALSPMNSKEYKQHLTELLAQTQVVYDANPWGE